MTYPKEFNYKEPQSEIVYQRQPTNRFDLNRILKGLPDIWITLSSVRKEKKRKLILADWTAFSWSKKKTNQIISELNHLMTEGYTIYLWQSGEIELLTQENITDKLQNERVREKMLPLDLSSVVEVAGSVNKIKSDELLILDDYWVYYLLHQNKGIQKRCLSVYKVQLLKESDLEVPITFFSTLIAQSKPPVEILIMDNFNPEGKKTLSQLEQIAPGAEVINYRLAAKCSRFHSCDDIDLISLHTMDDLKYFETYGDFKEHIEKFPASVRLKKMNILGTLNSIPKKTPACLSQLKELNLDLAYPTHKDLKCLVSILPHLKKISLPPKPTLEDIRIVVQGMKELKEISYIEITEELHKDLDKLLKYLSKFSVYKIKITMPVVTIKSILSILNTFRQSIEQIDLSGSKIVQHKIDDSYFLDLPFLKVLDLSDSSIWDDFFKLLTSSAPQLHTIDFSGTNHLTNPFFSSTLLGLKKIILSCNDILTLTRLQEIPALQQPSFSRSKEVRSLIKRLHLLEAPEYKNNVTHTISIKSINALSKTFPNIQTLDLYQIDLQGSTSGDLVPLKQLKTVNWIPKNRYNSINNINTLISLAFLAPALETLQIEPTPDFTKLPENLFPSLVSLLIDGGSSFDSLYVSELENYFICAPNIKIFRISNIDTFYGIFSRLTPGCLPNLKEFDLNGAPISSNNLEILYKAAPLLDKKTTEANLIEVDHDILEDPNSENEEDMTASSSSVIEDQIDLSNNESDLSNDEINLSTKQYEIQVLDANTDSKKTDFKVRHIFSPINHQKNVHPREYRLAVFQTTEINPNPCTIQHAFYQKKQGDLQLQSIIFSTAPANYEGVQNLLLTNEWQALASLSALEHMVHYEASQEIEINYSLRDNLYYIRQKPKPEIESLMNPIKVQIRFRLYVPEEPPRPESLQTALNYFLEFKEGTLSFPDQNPLRTGQEYLNAILTQKKGACRHRAFAFAHSFQQQIPIRIITNECHAFVEIQIGLTWIRCDLGGYPANIHTIEPRIELPVSEGSKVPYNNASISLFDYFLSAFQHIKKPIPDLVTADDYFYQCLQAPEKKWLIECDKASDADALHYGLWSYCQKTGHPIFYVHTPEDLICSAAFMSRDSEDKGVLHEGPGGPLYDFLNTHWKTGTPSPILMVNYTNFKSQDLACFNSLIDRIRLADSTPVPDEVVIIGLIEQNNPDTIPGADFYSRFAANRGLCPLPSEALNKFIPELPSSATITSNEAAKPYVINLFHAPDWEQRLLGQWVPDVTGGWRYEKGELEKALFCNSSLKIQNGLWNNKEFNRFWREAMLLGYIKRDQCHIHLPEHFTLSQGEGYDWATLNEHISLQTRLSLHSKILNPGTISDFFTHYDIENSRLTQVPGFIEQAKLSRQATLLIYLTRTVSYDIWAMLLEESKKYGVYLRVFCAQEANLPCDLGMDSTSEGEVWTPSPTEATKVICSTESDTTLFQLKQKYPDSITIDVSECTISDLLFNIEQETDRPFSFKKTTAALITLLNQEKTVILKGHFSIDLRDGLDPFLFNRLQQEIPKGCLIFLTEERPLFSYLYCEEHQVSVQEKADALGDVPEAVKPYLEKESLAKLRTRRDFISIQEPGQLSSDGAWEGLISLSANKKDPGLDLSLDEARNFHQGRIQQVKTILSRSPYIFLTGLSGVGKTTFVMNLLHKEGESRLYHGESGLLDWALNRESDLIKYLFWDEDNLNPSDRTQFEGFYDNNPPGILINGQYHTLTDTHKMIFAGNPLNIGGNRKLASFFARHGQALVFDPIPSNVLYHDVLKPLFIGGRLNAVNSEIICYELFKFYRFICQNSKDELLISPRELQMMALLTLSHYEALEDKEDAKAVSIASYFGYQITQSLLPKSLLPLFQETFPQPSLPQEPKLQLQDFYVTESRIPAFNLLNSFLSLRENRQNISVVTHQSYRSGGLGGLILEGEPGQGKSELVLSLLRSRGYNCDQAEKSYYHLPASMSLADKEKLLLSAFDKGAIVVIDEINCFPINEQLLNALLTGKTPTGQQAARPGFMIIGTQNPITMAGRNHFSTAIYRRLLKIELPTYTADEMYDILTHKGMLDLETLDLISAYEKQCALTIKSKRPTYRDLLYIAIDHLKTIKLAIENAKIGRFACIDLLIHSGRYSRIHLIDHYLTDLMNHNLKDDSTSQAYEGLVYLFASSQSMDELEDLIDECETDEGYFCEELNEQIQIHHKKRYTALAESGIFKENAAMKIKYEKKLAESISAKTLDPWFCKSAIKIKKLMEEQKITFRQAWLYTIHYQDIIQRMLLSYTHFPSFIRTPVLATLLGCSHEDAKQIYTLAMQKSKLPATHMFLDYTPSFFYPQASRQVHKEHVAHHESEEINEERKRKRA